MNNEVTLKDIAAKLSVSLATVDRAIHNRADINEETRNKILSAIEELGYRPNKIARTLVSGKTTLIGIILPLKPHFFWSEVERGVKYGEDSFRDFGIKIACYRLHYGIAAMKYTIAKLMNDGACAIILKPQNNGEIINQLKECREKGILIVTLNDDLKEADRLFYMGSDDIEAGRTAAQLMCLFLGGTGKVAVVRDFGKRSYSLEQRYSSFRDTLGEMAPGIELVDDSEQYNQKIGEYNAYLMTKAYLETSDCLAGIYNDSGNIYEAALALKDGNPGRKIVLIGHEVSAEVNDMVQQDYIDGIVAQDPFSQGFSAMKILCDYLIDGKEPESSSYLLHVDIFLKSNIHCGKDNE
jgi:LacI family transcriptional regulator